MHRLRVVGENLGKKVALAKWLLMLLSILIVQNGADRVSDIQAVQAYQRPNAPHGERQS